MSATERELLTEAEKALTLCFRKLLVVKPTLDVPYNAEAPSITPWTKFAEPAARYAHDVAMKLREHLRDAS